MNKSENEYSAQELSARYAGFGIDTTMADYFSRCIEFHTYPAPGILIGVFMVDYALELLGAGPGQKLYGVCETTKCLPDPLQVIIHCTTGNHRLIVIPIGRFAITLNRPSDGPFADGVRVYVDRSKIQAYQLLSAWYRNSPEFNPRTSKKALTEEILTAGRNILSQEKVRVRVTPKQKWNSATCSICGEMIPEDLLEGPVCGGCGSLRYYEKIK
jgi:formylmethanofuran dehydrogenase subunit E